MQWSHYVAKHKKIIIKKPFSRETRELPIREFLKKAGCTQTLGFLGFDSRRNKYFAFTKDQVFATAFKELFTRIIICAFTRKPVRFPEPLTKKAI